ncbi:MAG: acetylxylan esterase, partial [Bryobacteraceae bacterium]
MHRRILIWLMLAGPVLAQESGLDRYLTALAERAWTERRSRVATIKTPEEVRERQAYIRRKVTEALGGFPERTPLKARVTGTLQRDGYRVEKLIFESLPGFFVTANVYVPTNTRPPFPAMLGPAGHSSNGKASATYQHAWISLAKRGILVIAYDPPGQGERSEYFDKDTGRSSVGIGTGEHMMAGVQCLLTGGNIARYELWDGVRAFDYLLERGDVDPKRIGVAGNSGGGTQAAYLAVVEPRLAVASPSCYITSWEKLWVKPGPQDAEQNFPGFLSDGLDFGDFLISFAPRPVKMMTAIRDFFPIDGARSTYAEARRIYDVMGAADKIGYFEYDDTHGWSKPRREATYAWMDKWLAHRTNSAAEPEFDTDLDADLEVTTTGQVATSLGGETVQSLNRAVSERLHAKRTSLGMLPDEVRRLVAARLGVRDGLPVRIAQESAERVTLTTEPGIDVPALLLKPAIATGRLPAVLYLNPAGKSADAGPGGDVEALVRSGHIVLAPDLRGFGTAPAGRVRTSGYTSSWQTAMRAMLVGKTIAGMQVTDALLCFEYLAQRLDVDASRISVFGKGNGGVVALYVAALQPRIVKVAAEGAVFSYMAIARARVHEGLIDIIVPGVLKDFDLPDLAAAIAPRPVWLIEPRTPSGARARREEGAC